ncbi:MAG: hypothetical protein R3332_01400 [Pseudohongiellaceae bacterium]|nr:hypothetical protein [Pseudohongiellaceae bacterium]
MIVRSVAILGALSVFSTSLVLAQQPEELSKEQIMTTIITPTTATIWGAYQITDEQWAGLDEAAQTLVKASEATLKGGGTESGQALAQNAQWQLYAQQMLDAATAIRGAIADKDEERMFNIGNDELYPPCESCHQEFNR